MENKISLECSACNLHQERFTLVSNHITADTKVLFVSENPSRQDDLAGEILKSNTSIHRAFKSFLRSAGLDRHSDLGFANLVCCRPYTRKATDEEIKTCLEKMLNPTILLASKLSVIVALGGRPATVLTGKKEHRISLLRTKVRQSLLKKSLPVICTFHPHHISRNPGQSVTFIKDLELARKIAYGK